MNNQQLTYLKLARRCLLEIAELKGKNKPRYLLLKKKAAKYVQKAKDIESQV